MDPEIREVVDEMLEKNRQLCLKADAVPSAQNEGSAKASRGMAHAERRILHNIGVMTEVTSLT